MSKDHGADDVLNAGDNIAVNPSMVINEAAAKVLGFQHPEDAVGQFRSWTRPKMVDGFFGWSEAATSEIVGVVPDFSLGTVRDVVGPAVYYIDPAFGFGQILKIDGQAVPETLQAVKAAWAKQGAARPFEGMFLSQYFNDLYADVLQQSEIFSAFAGVAVTIAALGLLGLAVFTAEQRTKEMGLRKAMGASRADVLKFLAWQFAKPVLWANLMAWPVGYFAMQRWLEGFALHVDLSPWTFLMASAAAVAIAAATVLGHALLVARAKPVSALRYE